MLYSLLTRPFILLNLFVSAKFDCSFWLLSPRQAVWEGSKMATTGKEASVWNSVVAEVCLACHITGSQERVMETPVSAVNVLT